MDLELIRARLIDIRQTTDATSAEIFASLYNGIYRSRTALEVPLLDSSTISHTNAIASRLALCIGNVFDRVWNGFDEVEVGDALRSQKSSSSSERRAMSAVPTTNFQELDNINAQPRSTFSDTEQESVNDETAEALWPVEELQQTSEPPCSFRDQSYELKSDYVPQSNDTMAKLTGCASPATSLERVLSPVKDMTERTRANGPETAPELGLSHDSSNLRSGADLKASSESLASAKSKQTMSSAFVSTTTRSLGKPSHSETTNEELPVVKNSVSPNGEGLAKVLSSKSYTSSRRLPHTSHVESPTLEIENQSSSQSTNRSRASHQLSEWSKIREYAGAMEKVIRGT